jgi:hypothetical protein
MIFFIPMILGTLDIEELFVMEILLYTIPFRSGNNKMCFLFKIQIFYKLNEKWELLIYM